MFGEDIEPEEEYEESIAERVKTRRQNKETDRDTQRTFAPKDSSINLDDGARMVLELLILIMMQIILVKKYRTSHSIKIFR